MLEPTALGPLAGEPRERRVPRDEGFPGHGRAGRFEAERDDGHGA